MFTGLLSFAVWVPSASCGGLPEFPLQFIARIDITAHLVDRSKAYPPWLRRVVLHYDFVGARHSARPTILGAR